MITIIATKATKQLNAAYKTVYRKDSLPVLTHFHIYTQDKMLIVESTNLENASREKIDCRVENEINLCVPARAFKDWMAVIAKSYNKTQQIVFFANSTELYAVITEDGCKSKTHFHGMSSADFPNIDKLLPN